MALKKTVMHCTTCEGRPWMEWSEEVEDFICPSCDKQSGLPVDTVITKDMAEEAGVLIINSVYSQTFYPPGMNSAGD